MGGNDYIETLDPEDVFIGGAGDDSINTNFGTFYGGAGDDFDYINRRDFYGEAGHDTVVTSYPGSTFVD